MSILSEFFFSKPNNTKKKQNKLFDLFKRFAYKKGNSQIGRIRFGLQKRIKPNKFQMESGKIDLHKSERVKRKLRFQLGRLVKWLCFIRNDKWRKIV